MGKISWTTLAALGLALGFTGTAGAGEWLDRLHHSDCPRPSYSCFHYLTPSVYTFRAYHSDSPICVYSKNVDPTVTDVRIERFRCRDTSPTQQAAKFAELGKMGSIYVDPSKASSAPAEESGGR
jgi:hypothetical protein